jgi:hypothetical protein
MESLRIIALSILAAICYGVAHDQVTARICVEYFTMGHPLIFPTHSPTLLAFGWGVVATWWVGLPLGVLLAAAARLGRRPKLTWIELQRPILRLLLVMAGCALLAGIVGGLLAIRHAVWLVEPLATRVPADRHVPFLIDLWVHSASYTAGIVGGIVLAIWTWRHRKNISSAGASPNSAATESHSRRSPHSSAVA